MVSLFLILGKGRISRFEGAAALRRKASSRGACLAALSRFGTSPFPDWILYSSVKMKSIEIGIRSIQAVVARYVEINVLTYCRKLYYVCEPRDLRPASSIQTTAPSAPRIEVSVIIVRERLRMDNCRNRSDEQELFHSSNRAEPPSYADARRV